MRGFLWGVLKVTLFALAGYAIYFLISPEDRIWVFLCLFGVGIGYEINVIKEKLDNIEYKLSDLSRRMYGE